MNRLLTQISVLLTALLVLNSCAASSKIGEGDNVLVRNRIEIEHGSGLHASDVSSYIKQQPAALAPLSYHFWGRKMVYDSTLLATSVEKIKGHLEYMGYYDAKVSGWAGIHNGKAVATYRISPGERIRISRITFDLPVRGTFEEDFMADTANISVKPGDFLSEESLEAESERSAAAMRSKGYFGFSKNYYYFEADTLSGRDSVTLQMQVREYTRNESETSAHPLHKSHIGDVTISRPASLPFREKVIKDLNTIRPGSLYDETEINKTYERLRYLQVFSGVGIELDAVSKDTVDCNISLSSSRVQGFKADFETSTNSSGLIGISPQLSYYHKNFFNGGEWFDLGFLGNFQFRFGSKTRSNEFGISTGISFPKFLGLPNSFFKGSHIPRTEIKSSYNYQDRPEYTRSIASASFGYRGKFYQKFQYQFYPLQVNVVRLYDLDPAFYRKLESNPFMKYTYQDHFDAGAGGTLYYSSTPDINSRESFHYVRLAADVSGNILSIFKGNMKKGEDGSGLIWNAPFTQYFRTELTLGKTWRFGADRKHAVATRLLGGLGYAYGNTAALPFEKQFYCGGANSMRGWQARSVGPGRAPLDDTFIIPSQTGDVKLEANVEYRFPAFWKLEGAVFADAGNVWTINDENALSHFGSDFYKSIAADWGVGMRCDLNFLVVRIDLGMKVFEPSSNTWRGPSGWLERDGFAIHFGVGYPF